MQELVYEVEFLSDIVLPATSNTEGNIQQLDFIAGSNFLGMVAKEYPEFEKRGISFDIFHSGKVKFGDATILKEGKETYKMPLSYFFDKGKEEKLYNHHFIEDFKQFDQLKQKRNGYITKEKEVVYIDYNYSQKSAYDKKHRRSKDSSMFGYASMKKGSKWQFSIKIDYDISENDLELLEKKLIGKQRLGKSKSAQYGTVFIKKVERQKESIEDKRAQSLILYANSRLALVDEEGNPTYDLKHLFDGLNDDNIDYAKSQIKTSSFTPYNGAMQTKTYERMVINRGSVIVLKGITREDIPSFVGAYHSEGFGEILINPSFLMDRGDFGLGGVDLDPPKDENEIKSKLALFLKQKEDEKQDKLNILNEVDRFIKVNKSLYKNIKPSQWGKIRSICTSGEDGFREKIRAYISTGVKAWEETQIDTLLDDKNKLEFIKLLSIQMPKQKEEKTK